MKSNQFNLKCFLLSLSLFALDKSNAQVMEWVIDPSYKEIIYMGNDLYKVKGSNGKWGIYSTSKGELTVPAEYENISPLVEDRILILDAQGEKLYGIVDEHGIPVEQLVSASHRPDYVVMKEYPYYSDGLLVIGRPSGQYYNYAYANKQGKVIIAFNYLYACPFDHGQAMVYKKNGAYQIIDHDGKFQYVGNERINFMSNPKDGVFVLVTDNNRISKARLENSKFNRLEDIEKGKIVVSVSDAIRTKSINSSPKGNNYLFDNAFHLIEGNASSVISPVKALNETNGNLKKEKINGLYSLKYNNSQILPEQFKDVKIYADEYAIVTLANTNQVGVLKINPEGKISIDSQMGIMEFYHNKEQNIPIKISCSNLSNQPAIELSIVGDGNNRIYKCQGSGQIEIPYYKAHSELEETSKESIELDLVVDRLKFGRKEINVKSQHLRGYKISIGDFPQYSNKDFNATVNVSITSVGGSPSESAEAIINGSKHYFNGNKQLSIPVHFKIPQNQAKSCSVNVSVSEKGCPTFTSNKNATIKPINWR